MNTYIGLSSQEVETSRNTHGANVLDTAKKRGLATIFLSQLKDILTIILIVSAVISFFGGHHTDGIIILIIVILNSTISTTQEYRSEATLEALTKMINPTSRVIRNNQEEMIANADIVVGDIVKLAEGDKIPADAKILEAFNLSVNESALTGESVPVLKSADDTVFMGTGVAKGNATIEISGVGMQTEFGKIAHLSTTAEAGLSPLQKEIIHIGHFVAKVTFVIALMLFFLGLIRQHDFIDSLMFSVATAIAAVPEGLPTTITIALALGATVLLRKQALVKRLSAVETLGAVTTICSDKTGTLTQNQMTVEKIALPGEADITVSGSGYNPDGTIESLPEQAKQLEKLYEIMTFSNEAKYHSADGGSILGDPTEGALLVLAHKAGYQDQRDTERVGILPFDSDRKLMSGYTKSTLYTKGSPDTLIDRCTHVMTRDGIIPMSVSEKKKLKQKNDSLSSEAYRVLALAYRDISIGEELQEDASEEGMVFAGFVAIIDPPRPEVRDAIQTAYTAGVRVIVITGDNGLTARAIGQSIGLDTQGHALEVYEGSEVQKMSDEKLTEILKDRTKAIIFARAMPEQKMKIVEILQSQGEVVAMTGDGVNDAPALKKANVGVAMGITGTEVSKEASALVLLDDSFTTIISAIREGRRIYANLKKCVWFIFSCNIAELLLIFVTIILGLPIALTAILILCIDLGTDILPAVALGIDKGDTSHMKRPPRPSTDRILKKYFILHFLLTGLIIGSCTLGVFIYTLIQDGNWSETMQATDYYPHAIIMTFATLVVIQLINMHSARSLTDSVIKSIRNVNPMMIASWVVGLGILLLISYNDFLNELLHTTELTMKDWFVIFGVSFIPLVWLELWKYILRRKNKVI